MAYGQPWLLFLTGGHEGKLLSERFTENLLFINAIDKGCNSNGRILIKKKYYHRVLIPYDENFVSFVTITSSSTAACEIISLSKGSPCICGSVLR